MEAVVQAILNDERQQHHARMFYAVATGTNTVRIGGSTTEVELPYINPVTSGDYVLILAFGADRVILGPISQP